MDRFAEDVTEAVRDGETVTVNPDAGTLTIHRED